MMENMRALIRDKEKILIDDIFNEIRIERNIISKAIEEGGKNDIVQEAMFRDKELNEQLTTIDRVTSFSCNVINGSYKLKEYQKEYFDLWFDNYR